MIESDVVEARTLHARALADNARGRPISGRRTLKRALRLIGDFGGSPDLVSLRGRIWLAVAVCEAELRNLDSAVAALEHASVAAEAAGDEVLTVLVSSQRGSILLRTGRLDEANAALDVAVPHIRLLEPRDQAVLLQNRGTVALYLGQLRRAQADLGRAITVAADDELAIIRLHATHNLAYVRFLLGDLPAALLAMDEALRILPDLESGIPLLDRARVLVESGLVREADSTLSAAAEIFTRERLAQDLGETELERARCALIAGDPEAARRLAMRARDRFRRRGNERWRRSAELVLLQGDLAAGRPGKRLIGPALRLREEFERDGVRLPAQTAALIAAEAQLSAAQPAAARAALAGLGRTYRHDPITARLHVQYVRAKLDLAAGHAAAGSRRARKALDELAAYQASFGSIDLATAAAVHGRRLAELDLSIALSSGRAARVLAAAERARAVSNRLPAVRPPQDPEAVDLMGELRQTVETLRAVEQDRAASAPLLKHRRELEAEISARGWTRAGAGVVRDVVGLAELSTALGDSALVSFSRSAGALHAVVVDAGGLRLVTLGAADEADEQVRRVHADLDVLAQPRLPGPLRTSVHASLARSLAALDAALVRPLGLPGRLVIVSTGVLGQLPWGLLPSLRAVPVVVAPSATAWHSADTREPSRHRRVVAIAGPGLQRGVEETEAVGRIWGARLLTGADATGTAVAAAMAGARIAHVAAHGVHQTENPLFSSLRLADGPLFAHELDQSARTPDHVVLSACELGLATVRPGDEALGLTSVLLHLGTRSVVAGVARVGDALAEQTMADYHARLAGREDSAEALASALADAEPAPFVCFGAAWRR